MAAEKPGGKDVSKESKNIVDSGEPAPE